MNKALHHPDTIKVRLRNQNKRRTPNATKVPDRPQLGSTTDQLERNNTKGKIFLFLSFRFNLITICVLFSVDSFRVIPSLFIVTHWHFCDPQYHSYLIIMLTLRLTSATILDLQPEYNLESLSTPCWWLELIILPRFSSSISWMFDGSVIYKT